MLEGLAAWVLNNYLGKYVENLNTDQLSIALLSGKVELENLPLRKDALRHLGLPIEIKSGFIGKVKLQIPVRQIRSAPWVIAIEQLYLVASPLPVEEWDAESEELSAHEIKLSALDTIEARWRLETEARDTSSTYYASSYSSWFSFGAGLVSDIIENLQLKIQDVHIRYEDTVSVPKKCVAFGITMESLSAQSCDANWIPGFSHWTKGAESFKILEMQKFAVYWIDLDASQLLSRLSLGDLAVAMSPNQTTKQIRHYILAPVSAQAHVKRNRSEQPLRSSDTPRLVCDLMLDQVPLTLIDWQYGQIVTCIRGLDTIDRLRSYRRYKPPCTVAEDPRAWWFYALSCFHPSGKQPEICRPKPTVESCLVRAKQNVQYVQVYMKILSTPNLVLIPDDKKLKDEVEWTRGFEDLKVLREIAMKSVPMPDRNSTNGNSAGRSMLVRWFPQWMGWYSAPSQDTGGDSPETTQLEGEILQVLSDSAENNTILKRDAVFGCFNFSLKRGCLTLCASQEDTAEGSPMLELEFKNLSLNILSKPRTASHLIELSLGALHLKDKITLNTMFPVLMGPPGFERTTFGRAQGPSPRASVASRLEEGNEHLFYLVYEKKPQNSGCDYRLCIRSKCLDVVYQPNAVRWLTEFLCLPHQRDITQSQIEAMKTRTKKELIKNWEQILDGRDVARTTWELELDISAPQIIFVEHFTDNNSAMAVIDFGRLQLSNHPVVQEAPVKPEFITKESEDDETFLTPCSTPPASEASDSDEHTLELLPSLEPDIRGSFTEKSLHHRLYDRYCVELTDLQILIGKIKDNWRYAHNKGSSTLHVLDRFNISLQIEKRLVHTSDPLYPSLIINTNLPKLVAHLNESKITAARTLAHIITMTGLPSPFKTPDNPIEVVTDTGQDEDDSASFDTSVEMSRLLMVQFTVDQLSLEVQSRGRCVAELQVAGVKVAFTKRPRDISVTLTVHSLLLVDALQNFGPDFELLIASHKHVGMDSMSGSLRDSEPTSPTSPASPDPTLGRAGATSPIALKQALNSLATSPPLNFTGPPRPPMIIDAEALISIELVIVMGSEPVQIANIQFNNLDIIANQETIVELIGFTQRVFPKSQKASNISLSSTISSSFRETTASTESLLKESSKLGSTELTFDFHRLNVLLLRGVVREGVLCGKKICTATMSDAKIQATVADKVEVEGSLGGLQVLDLTPEGQMHQRIISVGRDPLLETMHPLYTMSTPHEDDRTAFSFKVVRSLDIGDKDAANVTIRMASLWYTHSPQFVMELQSCASEFKQYLSNLARSIRTAATDMALGLVHARAEALAQSLYMNARLSNSIYGSALSFSECSSPRRRRRSSSMDPSGFSSARDTIPQTPYSPDDDDNLIIDLKLDVELDSPVVVLPQASNSPKVFVAHLGKISINNKYESELEMNGHDFEYAEFRVEHYAIEIRDMNLFSVDTSNRRVPGPMIAKPEILYSCKSSAKPILHDTILQLKVEREINRNSPTRHNSESNLLLDGDETIIHNSFNENIYIKGSVVNDLKVSLTRIQYEQLLDTLQWLTSPKVMLDIQGVSRASFKSPGMLADISEEDTGVTTLNMDPHVRAKLFPSVQTRAKNVPHDMVSLRVLFELPIFTVELRGDSPTGEQGLVDLSFRDFIFNYEKCHLYETNIQVSLRSIFMEDLLQPENTKQRAMVVSSSGHVPQSSACVSKSCPDVSYLQPFNSFSHGSLPDHLETARVFGVRPMKIQQRVDVVCPCTPPPSPSGGRGERLRPERNLVLISTLLVDPSAPNFSSSYNSIQRSTSVDFNCLDLVISVESWVVVIDFFSASPSNSFHGAPTTNISVPANDDAQTAVKKENTETNVTVRSLTLVLVRPDREVAKANISNVDISIKTSGLFKEVQGKLGSMSLLDLTLHGQLYRERFITAGKQALQFRYVRDSENKSLNYDAQLSIDMSSVMYVHTKRFVAELQAFFNHFTQLQAVMKSIRAATSGQMIRDDPLKLSLVLKAGSPMILLPVSSKSSDILIVDLGQLLVTNSFKYSGDADIISVPIDDSAKPCLLDVMVIELENMDLYAGLKENEVSSSAKDCFKLGYGQVTKKGDSLLKEKFHLKLQVERNLSHTVCHNVPDMSIYGQLSTIDGCLDLSQYRLIRGLLAFNLGEDTERVLPSVTPPPVNADPNIRDVWTLSSLKLDLQNVTLCLQTDFSTSPLTCINFIKSRLTVEVFSNFSQDVDLISQEILILDTRFNDVPEDSRSNVFQNILQPIKCSKQENLVQAEIHSRKRRDHSKYTILLNNMRLMAVFDWWEAVQKYIFQEIENVSSSPEHQRVVTSKKSDDMPFELKLNITDSELVVVEDTSQWDSNAVILKSTTVITYKPFNVEKPLSCSLNNCEMFSCILGMEDETALSIIDPITLNMDINRDHILEAQLQFLTVRLSYHDMRMFLQMLNSLPKQMFALKEQNTQDVVSKNRIARLTALGFKNEDCVKALELCEQSLDDAALWLTQNAAHSHRLHSRTPLNVKAIEVKANCISICIIDDCGDSDVPLLELSFSQLNLYQLLPEFDIKDPVYPQGALECVLTGDYYNRVLSGWEPAIEPWKCKISWEKSLTRDLKRNRLNLKVESRSVINVNITSTLVELYKQVKENWTQDYYNGNGNLKEKSTTFRRRLPFVPFALKNDTGSPLHFTTLITELNKMKAVADYGGCDSWILVAPGETIPFSFRNRVKMRHHDSHKMKMHQLGVKVEGWEPLSPVTVDKVGTYFRITHAQVQNRLISEVPAARIVFDISLEGSARKLITVRSALVIFNKLPHPVDLKLESQPPHSSVTVWAPGKTFNIESGDKLAVPVVHAHSLITARPTGFTYNYTYCSPTLSWSQMPNYIDSVYEQRISHSHKGHLYRFCTQLVKDAHNTERNIHLGQPAHRIILLPAVKLCNLLPIDFNYNISGDRGRVSAGSNAAITNVDLDDAVELDITLENFNTTSKVVIPVGCSIDFKCRINLEDDRGRKLFLLAVVSPNNGASLKITISAPYWIINKTGLPLVFRQAGTSHESAGQFDEHEIARMVSPLLFSFSDQEASPTINARVGNYVIRDGYPQWCSNFHVQKGIQVKKLHVTMRDGKPDTVFIVGVEVRPGRGKYRSTSIITISPRYQLYNQSSYKLIFTQSCFAKNLTDSRSQKTCLKAMPNSHIPFHWPRLDKDQLLCVSIQDISDCCWSGGLKIDEINSLHVNVRDSNSRVYFLRLEVLLQGATFFIIFTDADTLPPPIRVDNFSEVTITFAQTCCKDLMRSTARAHTSVPYAWDQPTERQFLTVTVPGGVSETYDLNRLGEASRLTYENFIYIAFTGTFKNGQDVMDPLDVESQELVLDVIKGNQVILHRKRQGLRSQLWRMTAEGRLQHEGSSPPSHPHQPTKSDNILVLDIENTAPQPNTYSRLVLRRVDPRRRSTQTWRFTEEGRLCCAHCNMCVQAQDGFFGLRQGNKNAGGWQQWNSAVLGFPQPVCHKFTETGIPIEQAISRQRLRPGSGLLSVNIAMDGPTRVLSIKDMKESRIYATPDEREWSSISLKQRPNLTVDENEEKVDKRELQITVTLEGLGISLVCCKTPEELLYALFSNIVGETVITPSSKQFCISVGDVQIDNQLFETPVPVVLYVTPPSSRNNDELNRKLPAIDFTAELQEKLNTNADIFKHLILRLKKITIILEEKLLLKLFDFIGYHSREEELISRDENDYEVQRLLLEVSAAHSKRYYFGVIQLILDQIRLSVKTAVKLPPHLQKIKRKLGLTLIKFEDAAVDLQAFDRRHLFETSQFLINSIIKHFKDELMWQAGIILVSVDFLGNPLGFVNDVSEGFSGLLFEGNVGALVKNVTHGISNSAVKVTESISDGLGRAVLDDHHEEVRQKIRQVESGRSRDHIVAGFKGLGFGILGGATGLFKQVYEGASNDGFPGVISGIGKGLVGAVTKPVVGVLDFASETARAVRDSSRSKSAPDRIRLPRCVCGTGSLLPRYSFKQSQGQQYLYIVNDKNYKEQLVAYEILGSASEDLHCIVSNLKLRIVASTHAPDLTPVIDCHLSDLESCEVIVEKEGPDVRYYIEIVMHVAGTSAALVNPDPVKKPRVRCKSADLAKSVSQQIKYAKRLYFERLYTLSSDNIINLED